jgi:putative tryptophan/tyrosine transport system substrate-binding protein
MPQVGIGVLLPRTPNIGYLKSAEAAARAFNIVAASLPVSSGAEIESALLTLSGESNAGLIVAPNAVALANGDLIVTLAARYRLRAIYPFAFYAKADGLISYGFDRRSSSGKEQDMLINY